MSKVKPYVRKPHYYETDQMGIIHHSNYIRWFEEARLHFLDEVDIPYDKIEEEGIMIPVLSVSTNFIESVKYKEEISIYVKITAFNGVRMTIEYEIHSNEKNKLCNTGVTTHCFVDKNFKVVNLKKTNLDLYQKFLNNTEK
ncbi:MAG: acyl-CoA thioesterase [Bacilli bacterium]|nr:acyl-CoA thioesterase [Bacilli bacterium]